MTASQDYFGEHQPADDHSGRSLRAGAVSLAARAVNAFVQIGTVLFLARLLTPEDYGLISMVTALTGFAPLLDLGTRDAVAQRSHISRGEVSALFWLTMALGAIITVVMALAAPGIAWFYGESRLLLVVPVMATTFIACGLSTQHYGLMRRALQFKELAAIEIAANVITAVLAVAGGLLGAGYWALVLRPIGTPALVSLGVWLACRWVPGRPEVTPGVKESLKFGLNIMGFTLTDFVGRSGDRVAIGYAMGASVLGLYQNALFVYTNVLDILVFPLHAVAITGLSKLRHDLPALRAAWTKALSTLAFYAMPGFGLLAVLSQDLMTLLLGPKWETAGTILSVLALRGIPQCVERTQGWLHVTSGRTDRWVRWGVLSTISQFVALFFGLPFGPMGVAVAYVVQMFLLCVPAVVYSGHPLEITTADVVRTIWRQLVAALGAAVVVDVVSLMLMVDMAPLARMAVSGVLYVAVYLGVAVAVLGLRTPLHTMQSLLRGYLPLRVAQRLN
ncbi:MAG TPA: lipopolysaccharide biosynthesis protein [Gemmatimonadales bacterium]|nr:lipopolysaccharide biosynthesis protein [Gemmatimonadales bacterium]